MKIDQPLLIDVGTYEAEVNLPYSVYPAVSMAYCIVLIGGNQASSPIP